MYGCTANSIGQCCLASWFAAKVVIADAQTEDGQKEATPWADQLNGGDDAGDVDGAATGQAAPQNGMVIRNVGVNNRRFDALGGG